MASEEAMVNRRVDALAYMDEAVAALQEAVGLESVNPMSAVSVHVQDPEMARIVQLESMGAVLHEIVEKVGQKIAALEEQLKEAKALAAKPAGGVPVAPASTPPSWAAASPKPKLIPDPKPGMTGAVKPKKVK